MNISESKHKWDAIKTLINKTFNRDPDLNAILYIIGMRELGVLQDQFSKEEKVRLMHIAVCRVLSETGYYKLEGVDGKGWPNWVNVQKLPHQNMFEQENFLRQHIIHYFEIEELI